MKKIIVTFLIFLPVITFSQTVDALINSLNTLYINSFEGKICPSEEVTFIIKGLQHISLSKEGADSLIINKKDIAELIRKLELFKNSELQRDSAYKPLYSIYLKFTDIFNNYNINNLYNLPKKKIVYLTTSVSCVCTLNLCQKQLANLIKFTDSNKDEYILIVEDTWNSSFFKNKYAIGFVPTVIMLDEKNNEKGRFIREENIDGKLSTWVKNKD